MGQRAKQVRTNDVIIAFLRNQGNLVKAAEEVKLQSNKVRTADMAVRDKMRAVLQENEFALEWHGKAIPKGEEGYEEGKENRYDSLTSEEVVRTTKLVEKLKSFPILVEDQRGRKKQSVTADSVWAEMEGFL